MTKDEILTELLHRLKKQTTLVTYNSVLKYIEIYSYENEEIIITINDGNNKSTLTHIQNSYSKWIEKLLNEILNKPISVKYIPCEELEKRKETEVIKEKIEKNTNVSLIEKVGDRDYEYCNKLHKEFTFDMFVVGKSNEIAFNSALNTAKNPGVLFNPLYIYSHPGMGKTHLMQAIGNYIQENSNNKVLYITSNEFYQDYIAINKKTSEKDNNVSYKEAFYKKYTDIDVLMMDDIQELDGKSGTLKEFFNIFNSLFDKQKQIVLASDRSTEDFKNIEERVRSRFKSGLTVVIKPPEIDLKREIIINNLNNMAVLEELNLSDEVINYVANNCGKSIRDLKGCLSRLLAYKSMFKEEYTIENVTYVLNEYIDERVFKTNSIAKILNEVSKYYDISENEIKGKGRKKNIATARHVTIYLCKTLTEETLERIGLEIGGRDHATVLHSISAVEELLKKDTKLQEEIKLLKEKICD